MCKTDEMIIEKLKMLIDKQGPDYLMNNPLVIYKKLISDGEPEAVMAGAIVMLLVSDLWNTYITIKDVEKLSREIQEDCYFKKKMSDRLASIVVQLYSSENQADWKSKTNAGLKHFGEMEHTFKWSGFSVWDAGNGTVDCHYYADIVLKPVKKLKNNKALQKELRDNPFISSDAIYKLFDAELSSYLSREFDEYCTCDDYYQPVVEDFEIEYYVAEWCKENGFELVSCDGDGSDDGYEPKRTGRWH